MGRVSTSELLAESTPVINHFSHPHPLQLFKFQPHQTLSLPSCKACNLKPTEIVYACLSCNYYLHQTCSRLPQNITHRCHSHQLKVTLSPPYPNQMFSCDICKKTGSNEWLYRCDSCEFDAHLNCGGNTVQVASPQENVGRHEVPSLSSAEMFLNSFNNSVNANLAAIATGVAARQDQNHILHQISQPTSNDMTSYNSILQGIIGGGGGIAGMSQLQGLTAGASGVGSASQLQGLMGGGAGNPLQGLIGGGAGNPLQGLIGGGAGNPLQAFMGNSGGVDLQALMGGSGGGGTTELLQSLIGGGGGAGTASLLQGFLGGLGGM